MNKNELKNAPYIHDSEVAMNLHADLLIGLVAVMITAIALNGLRVLVASFLSAFAAWLTETLGNLIVRRRTGNDLRSIAIGIMVALICPITVPIWLPVAGAVFSVLFVRVILGPAFKNLFLTPVIGWIFMLTIEPKAMTTFSALRGTSQFPLYENVVEFQPIASISQYLQAKRSLYYTPLDLLSGDYAGPMGTTCIFVIFAVCIYFVFRKSMAWQVSFSMIATVALFAVFINRTDQSAFFSVIYELTANSYIFVAVFIAGDIISAPMLNPAKITYGITIGVLTMLFRYAGLTEYSLVVALLISYFFTEFLDLAALKIRTVLIKYYFEKNA